MLVRNIAIRFLATILCLFTSAAFAGNSPQDTPWIIAHRGASANAPENTIAAFQEAWKQGADGIEGDFRLSKDGAVVCVHDKTTKRCGDQDLEVSQSTLAQLKAVDVGSWKNERFKTEQIPTLQEVLATLPHEKQIFIELKVGIEIVEPTRKAIAKSGVKEHQITIISFNADVVAACRKAMPNITANWLTSIKIKDGQLNPTLEKILQTLDASDASGIGMRIDSAQLDNAFIKALRTAGMGIHCWTINDAKEAHSFKKFGFDSITTDKPGYLIRSLDDTRATLEDACDPSYTYLMLDRVRGNSSNWKQIKIDNHDDYNGMGCMAGHVEMG